MAIVDRSLLLEGTDLKEKTVRIDAFEGDVVVRPLAALFASEAQGSAAELTTDDDGNQVARINQKKLEVLQVLHGLVEPKLNSTIEVEQFLKQWGPGGQEVIRAIDEASLIDKEAIAATATKFPAGEGGEGTDGADPVAGAEPAPAGSDGSDG